MKYVFSMTLALALLASAPALAEDIDVMTQNQYLGADLTPIVTAGDAAEFNAAVVAALEDVAANDFPARAHALAELIARRLPALVGLQEVFTFTCMDLAPPTADQGCDNPRIRNAFNDHLALTLAALADLEEDYSPVATVVNIDTTTVTIPPFPPGIPFFIDGVPALANIIDHDVILVRGDLAGGAAPVDFTVFQHLGICTRPSADGCNYVVVATATLPDPDPDGTILNIERGYVGVDVTVDGKDYRFIDTHLEVQEPQAGNELSAIVQAAQAQELIASLGPTTPAGSSLIVVGDINSSPDDPPIVVPEPLPPGFPPVIVPPYTQFVGLGYTDAWDGAHDDLPGFSCCQDDDLLNQQSSLVERIDVIFSIEAWNKVKKARVLGAKVSDKTAPPDQGGLWPSDHGSVAAELQFE